MRSLGCALAVVALLAGCTTGSDESSGPTATAAPAAGEPAAGREGKLDVDEPAAVPAWSDEDDPRGQITLDHLLRMSSGLEWDEAPYPQDGDLTRVISAHDAAAYVAAKELAHEPGTRFLYNSGGTLLIARILADEVGERGDFAQFMNDELLDKLGITGVRMNFDGVGTWQGAYAADASARDFARFGLLYLRDGVWDGERILPEGWVDYSRWPSAANPEYGAHSWVDTERPGVFYALGRDGQVIAVDPAHDLTFVLLATEGQMSLTLTEAILDAFAAGK